jgi:hypothetical protein
MADIKSEITEVDKRSDDSTWPLNGSYCISEMPLLSKNFPIRAQETIAHLWLQPSSRPDQSSKHQMADL